MAQAAGPTVVEANPGTAFTLRHRHFFDEHQYGSDLGIPDGRIEIQRGSDGAYWTGAIFDSPQAWVATTVGGSGLFDEYDFTVPSSGDDTYNVRMQHNDDPATEYTLLLVARTVSSSGGSGGGATGSILDVPPVLLVPTTGTNTYRVELVVVDTDGDLSNADSTPTLTPTDSAGATPTGIAVGSVTNDSTGRYHADVTVATTADPGDQTTFAASFAVGGESRLLVSTSSILAESPDVEDAPDHVEVRLLPSAKNKPT